MQRLGVPDRALGLDGRGEEFLAEAHRHHRVEFPVHDEQRRTGSTGGAGHYVRIGRPYAGRRPGKDFVADEPLEWPSAAWVPQSPIQASIEPYRCPP